MRKKGIVLLAWRQEERPSSHQAHRQRTSGRITVEDLAAIASAAKIKLNPYFRPPPPALGALEFFTLSHWAKKRVEHRKNKPDSVFFISVTHATDSTITG
jgi:hypothetical protein